VKNQEEQIEDFLSNYPENVRDLGQRLRRLVRSVIPNAREELDRAARIIGFSLGPGYAGLICTLILSQRGIKLGIARSAQLLDPERLLEGAGRRHRYVPFEKLEDLDRSGIKTLIRAAAAAWSRRTGGCGD
jgi:hypothetical protein